MIEVLAIVVWHIFAILLFFVLGMALFCPVKHEREINKNEKELREHLKTLDKETVIELYLQKSYEYKVVSALLDCMMEDDE